MKKIFTFFIISCICFTLFSGDKKKIQSQSPSEEESTRDLMHWGFFGSLEMGGMYLLGDGLKLIEDNGYGTIGKESIIVSLTGGISIRKPELFDTSLVISYAGGGSFLWDDIFGEEGNFFPLHGDSFSLQIEAQPLFPLLQGFHPFIGGGYSLTNGLIDEYGDGFVDGKGPFIVGGMYIFNSLGLSPLLPFEISKNGFFGIRISIYYRFPYKYNFKLDWEEFQENYFGPADIDAMEAFFDNTFQADSLMFSIGLSLGLTGFSF